MNGEWGCNSIQEHKHLSSPQCSDWLWDTGNLSELGAVSPGAKQPGHEAEHKLPTSVEVNES